MRRRLDCDPENEIIFERKVADFVWGDDLQSDLTSCANALAIEDDDVWHQYASAVAWFRLCRRQLLDAATALPLSHEEVAAVTQAFEIESARKAEMRARKPLTPQDVDELFGPFGVKDSEDANLLETRTNSSSET